VGREWVGRPPFPLRIGTGGSDDSAVRRVYPEEPSRNSREGSGPVCRILAGVIWLTLGLAQPASAGGIYRYVDPQGVVHFTNVQPDSRYHLMPDPRGLIRVSVGPAAPSDYDFLIERASRAEGVPPAMVKAVIQAESAFDPTAVSPKGAMGLMQLMPQTARALGVSRPFEATQNVFAGTRYLRELYDRYGNWVHTLAAYNAGPSVVDRSGGVPPIAETRQYVKRVLSYYRRFHGDFAR
jgi:hypothetical protein